MKTTLKYIAIMATLAVFSTLSQDVMAQKTSSASMTIKATVIESTSLKSISDLVFSAADVTESGYKSEMNQAAGFSIAGIVNTEIGISFKAPEMKVDDSGNSIFFTPTVKVGNQDLGSASESNGRFLIEAQEGKFRGQTSVWIEGLLQSKSEMALAKYQGDYIVSIDYN
ncbi:MAG TPA: hypothetical protein DCE78_04535 [Bacteroidetes bacterium]|nr:hypothetical protein [Bacteroidota bacterium]